MPPSSLATISLPAPIGQSAEGRSSCNSSTTLGSTAACARKIVDEELCKRSAGKVPGKVGGPGTSARYGQRCQANVVIGEVSPLRSTTESAVLMLKSEVLCDPQRNRAELGAEPLTVLP